MVAAQLGFLIRIYNRSINEFFCMRTTLYNTKSRLQIGVNFALENMPYYVASQIYDVSVIHNHVAQ